MKFDYIYTWAEIWQLHKYFEHNKTRSKQVYGNQCLEESFFLNKYSC